jgi:hypothetical protein
MSSRRLFHKAMLIDNGHLGYAVPNTSIVDEDINSMWEGEHTQSKGYKGNIRVTHGCISYLVR